MSKVLNVIKFIIIWHFKKSMKIGRNCIATENTYRSPKTDFVQPQLEILIPKRLAWKMGYRSRFSVFYVSICNEKREAKTTIDDEKQRMSPLWRSESNKFNARLRENKHLEHLVGRMFFICNGNHRLQAWTSAWTSFIDRKCIDHLWWHISVDSICLDLSGKIGLLLHAMHNINK